MGAKIMRPAGKRKS